jgi:NAD(P)-dependent dehydrogenase (short-subunit alcohol dehydrogenase family)
VEATMNGIFDLSKKIIAVTGGYGHLGGAMVEGLLLHGADVLVLARSKSKFENRFKNLERRPNFFNTDINDLSSVRHSVESITQQFGKLDGLINNAFSLEGGTPPEAMSDEIFLSGLTGSLLSAYRLIREFLPLIRKSTNGSIINISSMYGMVAPEFSIYESAPASINPPHYGVAKAGLLQLTRYLASWLGGENIRVNSISPGPFPSPEVARNKTFIEALANKTALKRVGDPKDLQGAVIWLCSDASSFVTGQNIVVDGGWTII